MANDKRKGSSNFEERIPFFIILFGFFFFLLGPFSLTRRAIWTGLDFSNVSSNIGTTIGGIAGPIISFMGALLVYFSFRAQTKANRYLQYDLERNNAIKDYEEINSLTSQIKELVEGGMFTDKKTNIDTLNLKLATNKDDHDHYLMRELRHLIYIFETVDFTATKIRDFQCTRKSFTKYKSFSRTGFLREYYSQIEDFKDELKNMQRIKEYYEKGNKTIEHLHDHKIHTVTQLLITLTMKIINVEFTLKRENGIKSPFWDDEVSDCDFTDIKF